jgi:Outer membrane protein beta-barrel domain
MKIMKKFLILIVLLLFVVLNGRTQGGDNLLKGIYIKAAFGAGVGTNPAILNQYNISSQGEGGNRTITEALKANLGSGLPLEIAGGYKFNENYGVELGVDYFYGFSKKKVDVIISDQLTTKVSASMLSIIPSFVMQLPCGKVNPYARFGVEVGIVNSFYTKMTGPTYMFKAAATQGVMNTKDYGGIAIGGRAAVGVDYPISKLIALFGEIQVRSISFSPKHGKVTKFTVEGQDQLASLPAKQAKWDFVKSTDSNTNISNDQPNQFLRNTHSVSNAALVIGVKVNLGK